MVRGTTEIFWRGDKGRQPMLFTKGSDYLESFTFHPIVFTVIVL